MLTDQEIENAVRKLADFRAKSAEEDFLQRYADLLVSYQQLKSDYEEEKVNRERYKQLARTQDRNPFVLVIVDGDGYIFKDDFLRQGADGGTQAAHHLNGVLKQSLREKNLENCDIMIRIYANLANLSRTLSKHGLATPDKRSLAPFVASFNRSYGLVDFVDAGEFKENADFKIRALLDLHAENAQCKHIYFAACHDVGYISELTKFRGDRSKVTLVRSSGLLFHDQFLKLELGIEELPGVFRTSPLNGPVIPQTRVNPNIDLMRTAPPTGSSATNDALYRGISSRESQKICQFYQSGKCRYGNDCKNTHIDTRSPTQGNSAKTLYSHQAGNSNHDIDATSGAGRVKPWSSTSFFERDDVVTGAMHQRGDAPAHQLPNKTNIPDGHVAVNNSLQRLDAYMPPPNSVSSSRLRELSGNTRFCNSKQLTNYCPNEQNCEYEHRPLPEDLLPALEWLSRSLPCSRRGSCRAPACVQGHICQNMECYHRGGKAKCKFPAVAHAIDFTFAQYLPGANYVDPINTNDTTRSPSTMSSPQLPIYCDSIYERPPSGTIRGSTEHEM